MEFALWTITFSSTALSRTRVGEDVRRFLTHIFVALLPFRFPESLAHLDGRHFVLGAVRRPVRVLGGDHVGGAFGMVEGRVDHAGLHPLRDAGPQRRFTGP